MSQSFVRARRSTDDAALRPKLRIYDRRISALLASMGDPADGPAPNIDLTGWLQMHGPLLEPGGNLGRGYQIAKRVFDVLGALFLAVVLAPVMIPTWLVLYFTTGGSPIFRQTRVGRCGKRFEMYKFRTMRVGAHLMQTNIPNEQSGPVFKNRRDPRITPIGNWLRRLSIDEMPQVFNVLRGDMSLVGPRPPIPAEVTKYQPWQCGRLSVKPGLTCVWQVSGRCEIEFDTWVRLDLWYVKHQSAWVDLRLLLRTPWSVLSCRGAY